MIVDRIPPGSKISIKYGILVRHVIEVEVMLFLHPAKFGKTTLGFN
jgi:hypothetical protein